MVDAIFALTEPVVMVHLNLQKPRAFGKKGHESGTPKYSGNLLLKAASLDLASMKKIAAEVARAEWPGRPLAELKFPFSNGTKIADKRKAECERLKIKPDGEFNRDMVVVAARSKFQPGFSVFKDGRIIDLEDEATIAAHWGSFYNGVLVLAEVNFKAYPGVGANPDGVTCYLNKVMSTGKGTKIIMGGSSGSQTFSGYRGGYSAEDPGPSSADEMPGF